MVNVIPVYHDLICISMEIDERYDCNDYVPAQSRFTNGTMLFEIGCLT
jgi:hypothetical protein